MRLIYLFILPVLFLSSSVTAQQVEWVKRFPKDGYSSTITLKTDSDGNIYLVNSHPSSRNSGSITKMDAAGKVLWGIDFFYPAGQNDQVMNFTLDPAGNFYGILAFAGNEGFEIKAKNGTFPVGKSPMGASYSKYDEKVLTFKLSKDGEYHWSTLFSTYNYHTYKADLSFDPITNTLYHISAYAYYLKSDKTTLNTLATSDRDLVPTVFFCAFNAETGEEQVLKNLHIGLPGSLVPLNDRLPYFYSGTTTSSWLQLSPQGDVKEHKTVEPSMDAASKISGPFLIQSGKALYNDPVYGRYDPHNRIRISDLYGDVVVEKEFFFWSELYQHKFEVFGNFALQPINENNLLALISGAFANLDTDKTQFDGETLTERDFRFLFFDRDLNITKKLQASSSNRLLLSDFLYSEKDQMLYLVLESRVKNSFTVGGTVIDIPPDRNYILVKLRMDELKAASGQANVLGFLVDGQVKTARIDHENKIVTAYVGPGSDLARLSHRLYVSDGAKLKYPLSSTMDFSLPKQATVVSALGKEQEWTLQVDKTYGTGNSIELVEFPGQLQVLIDSLNKKVEVVVASNVDPGNLRLSDFKASDFATVSPDPLQISDFSQTQQLLITAENGEESTWSLHVSRKLLKENKIMDFRLQDQLGPSRINDIDNVIEVTLALYADWKQAIEHIILSPGAKLLSHPNNADDFSTEVRLTVEAEDGTQAVWTVKAQRATASNLGEAMNVYPIPADYALTVDLLFLEKAPATLELVSTNGQTILRKTITPAASSRTTLNIGPIKPGLYLLRLTHANQVHAQKIIIQR